MDMEACSTAHASTMKHGKTTEDTQSLMNLDQI